MPPPDGQPPHSRLQFDQGDGLLQARALWAAQVGPWRLAMAKGSAVELRNDRAEEIAKNMGAANAVMVVGVSFRAGGPFETALFGDQETLGENTSAPYSLSPNMGPYGEVPGFVQILLPGEQIYGQLARGGTPRLWVVVKQVQF